MFNLTSVLLNCYPFEDILIKSAHYIYFNEGNKTIINLDKIIRKYVSVFSLIDFKNKEKKLHTWLELVFYFFSQDFNGIHHNTSYTLLKEVNNLNFILNKNIDLFSIIFLYKNSLSKKDFITRNNKPLIDLFNKHLAFVSDSYKNQFQNIINLLESNVLDETLLDIETLYFFGDWFTLKDFLDSYIEADLREELLDYLSDIDNQKPLIINKEIDEYYGHIIKANIHKSLNYVYNTIKQKKHEIDTPELKEVWIDDLEKELNK